MPTTGFHKAEGTTKFQNTSANTQTCRKGHERHHHELCVDRDPLRRASTCNNVPFTMQWDQDKTRITPLTAHLKQDRLLGSLRTPYIAAPRPDRCVEVFLLYNFRFNSPFRWLTEGHQVNNTFIWVNHNVSSPLNVCLFTTTWNLTLKRAGFLVSWGQGGECLWAHWKK